MELSAVPQAGCTTANVHTYTLHIHVELTLPMVHMAYLKLLALYSHVSAIASGT